MSSNILIGKKKKNRSYNSTNALDPIVTNANHVIRSISIIWIVAWFYTISNVLNKIYTCLLFENVYTFSLVKKVVLKDQPW